MLSDREETAVNLVDYRVTPLQAAFLDGANVVLKTQFSVLFNLASSPKSQIVINHLTKHWRMTRLRYFL